MGQRTMSDPSEIRVRETASAVRVSGRSVPSPASPRLGAADSRDPARPAIPSYHQARFA